MASSPKCDPDRENLAVITLRIRALRATGFSNRQPGHAGHSVLVRVPEVLRLAVARNAYAIVVAHNHPSGDPLPSDADVTITRKLAIAARQVGIELIDHVIIGRENVSRGFVSLHGLGLIGDGESEPARPARGVSEALEKAQHISQEIAFFSLTDSVRGALRTWE